MQKMTWVLLAGIFLMMAASCSKKKDDPKPSDPQPSGKDKNPLSANWKNDGSGYAGLPGPAGTYRSLTTGEVLMDWANGAAYYVVDSTHLHNLSEELDVSVTAVNGLDPMSAGFARFAEVPLTPGYHPAGLHSVEQLTKMDSVLVFYVEIGSSSTDTKVEKRAVWAQSDGSRIAIGRDTLLVSTSDPNTLTGSTVRNGNTVTLTYSVKYGQGMAVNSSSVGEFYYALGYAKN